MLHPNGRVTAMQLERLDWAVIIFFFALTLVIGLLSAKRAGKNTSEYFLSGRSMPWWLLGMSMVATTFSTDTPNLVTDIVRNSGVAGNWAWWAFLLTGMLTVFVYARLWRRSGITTDIEFYELRYSGKPAAFLRGFRALYLGVLFNVLIMGLVSLAAIKIGSVLFGFSSLQTLLLAGLVTVVFSSLGGFRAVLLTDFILFIIAMIGALAAAIVAVRHVGGMDVVLNAENVRDKLSIVPAFTKPDGTSNMDTFASLIIIPLAVQWWSVWYPGAEPGGGGYLAQRMLAAKDEKHAVGATLFFNAAHYALRPWPWIIVALCSLVVFPDLDSLRQAFPNLAENKIGHDVAYPAMLTFLPTGLMGLVVASLAAAYMSTISTHLNWGSSYIVNDFWARFINKNADQKELVWVGRISTVLLMLLAAVVALGLTHAKQAFDIILMMGAGTGLIFILRWFWWRINPYSEITAMLVSFVVSLYLRLGPTGDMRDWQKLLLGVGITTLAWIVVTFLTPADDTSRLRKFYRLIQPGGPGWRKVIREAEQDGENIVGPQGGKSGLPMGILCMLLGTLAVYCSLFATGYWIYGRTVPALVLTVAAVVATLVLIMFWKRVAGDSGSSESMGAVGVAD